MHRIFKMAAGTAALAVAALTATTTAADADTLPGVEVSKGTVSTAMGWNKAAYDQNAETVTFTATAPITQTKTYDVSYSKYVPETGWETIHVNWVEAKTYPTQQVDATAVKNPSGAIVGWTLNGLGAPTGTPTTTSYNERTVPAGYKKTAQNNTPATATSSGSISAVQVNGSTLPSSTIPLVTN